MLENTPFIDNFPIDADSQFPCLMTSEASVNRDSETGGKHTAATDVLLWSRTWGVATLFCWAGVGQFFLGVIKHGWEIPHSLAEK